MNKTKNRSYGDINYVEQFTIPGLGTFRISRESPNCYKVWMCGGCFGSGSDLDHARCLIHDWAKEELARRMQAARDQLNKYESANNALGCEMFRLGKFMEDVT